MSRGYIHQIWVQGYDAMPAKYKKQCSAWREKNPDYEYCFWDGESLGRLIRERYPECSRRFQSYSRPVLKADMGRIAALCEYGGFYVDVDTECVRPISSVFCANSDTAYYAPNSSCALSWLWSSPSDKDGNNYCLAGPADHRLWKLLLKRMLKDATPGGSLRYTGPFGDFQELLNACRRKGILVRPFPVGTVLRDTVSPTAKTFCRHAYDSNWAPLHGLAPLRRFAACPQSTMFLLLAFAVAIVVLYGARRIKQRL